MKENKQNIVVIDNYDSFTYNLVYLLKLLAPHAVVDVFRNDEVELKAIEKYDKILLSPGPSLPDEAGILKAIVEHYAPCKSILGICLGHQAIAEVFGAELYNMKKVKHGVEDELCIVDQNETLFNHVPDKSKVGLYHSWSVASKTISECLNVTAHNSEGNIMGLRHRRYDVAGLQFHPESILTDHGSQIIKNWLNN